MATRSYEGGYREEPLPRRSGVLGWGTGAGITLGLLAFFGLLTAWLSYYTIDQGDVGIVKRWGERVAITDPGLHFKIPYIDSVDEIEVRERKLSLEMDSSSKDPMTLPLVVSMNWAVSKKDIGMLYDEYGGLEQFGERILKPRFNDGAKTAASRFTVNELVTDRDKLRAEIIAVLKTTLPLSVMQITGLAVEDVKFPPEYIKQIRDKQVAREAALTEKYTLEQQKYKTQQITQTAEAQRDADKAKADGEAYAVTTKGQAEIAIIEAKGKAIATNPLIIQYTNATNWRGELPATFIGGEQAGNILFQLPSGTQRAATTP
jgi:regulator of protease activity HflC (stomatin/prohibitin superfamily)